ncbi:LysR substrate-binding domain-containing protein [Lysobacter capsici]|uniref:LysR substrate-binding domain-containing protein n=1 Tax=Lysobacter capsici TaxID=435897 RepID=UPI00287B7122|nr:LysR substrate-binding domain-containing protein [Lysobacter capsici]WND81545.1 LysR substrate-binding domain-containing protein [Lysobacter capsici]WND86741.1 LysR substrate-binding domain-containing protein [Lysobacter capsici]
MPRQHRPAHAPASSPLNITPRPPGRPARAARAPLHQLPSAHQRQRVPLEIRTRRGQARSGGRRPLIVTEPDVTVCAAPDGGGIAYLLDFRLREHLAAGRLLQLVPEWTPALRGFYLYYPSRRQLPEPLRVFVDFLREQARSSARASTG